MAVVRWTISGPMGTIQFPLNPREGVLPLRQKQYTATTSADPDGAPIIYQGRDEPRTFPFTGTILYESHYDFFVEWYDAEVPCTVVDELGNSFQLWLTKFEPRRKIRHNYPWMADYDCEALVVG